MELVVLSPTIPLGVKNKREYRLIPLKTFPKYVIMNIRRDYVVSRFDLFNSTSFYF